MVQNIFLTQNAICGIQTREGLKQYGITIYVSGFMSTPWYISLRINSFNKNN